MIVRQKGCFARVLVVITATVAVITLLVASSGTAFVAAPQPTRRRRPSTGLPRPSTAVLAATFAPPPTRKDDEEDVATLLPATRSNNNIQNSSKNSSKNSNKQEITILQLARFLVSQLLEQRAVVEALARMQSLAFLDTTEEEEDDDANATKPVVIPNTIDFHTNQDGTHRREQEAAMMIQTQQEQQDVDEERGREFVQRHLLQQRLRYEKEDANSNVVVAVVAAAAVASRTNVRTTGTRNTEVFHRRLLRARLEYDTTTNTTNNNDTKLNTSTKNNKSVNDGDSNFDEDDKVETVTIISLKNRMGTEEEIFQRRLLRQRLEYANQSNSMSNNKDDNVAIVNDTDNTTEFVEAAQTRRTRAHTDELFHRKLLQQKLEYDINSRSTVLVEPTRKQKRVHDHELFQRKLLQKQLEYDHTTLPQRDRALPALPPPRSRAVVATSKTETTVQTEETTALRREVAATAPVENRRAVPRSINTTMYTTIPSLILKGLVGVLLSAAYFSVTLALLLLTVLVELLDQAVPSNSSTTLAEPHSLESKVSTTAVSLHTKADEHARTQHTGALVGLVSSPSSNDDRTHLPTLNGSSNSSSTSSNNTMSGISIPRTSVAETTIEAMTATIIATEEEEEQQQQQQRYTTAARVSHAFVMNEFTPAWFAANRHFQTIIGTLYRKETMYSQSLVSFLLNLLLSATTGANTTNKGNLPIDKFSWTKRERIETPDGDFFYVDWSIADDNDNDNNPVCLICHGLESCSESEIAQEIAIACNDMHMDAACLNFRGCSNGGAECNLTPRAYHLGFTDDLMQQIMMIHEATPRKRIYLSGFSLGAGVVTKLLSDLGDDAYRYNICGAAVNAVPFDAGQCAYNLNGDGFTRKIYGNRLLNSMKDRLRQQYDSCAGFNFEKSAIDECETIMDMENLMICSVFGFDDAFDYYDKVKTIDRLDKISVPQFILQAEDDPFFEGLECPPNDDNTPLTIQTTKLGGHCGYICQTMNEDDSNISWMPAQLGRFFAHVDDSCNEKTGDAGPIDTLIHEKNNQLMNHNSVQRSVDPS